MRKPVIVLVLLLCCALLMGAARQDAPILPTKNFYINDYANVISGNARNEMLETAQDLNEKTGIQVVVLTVENLGGKSIEEYARLIFEGWEIGGNAQNGILALFSKADVESYIKVGGGIKGSLSGRDYIIRIHEDSMNSADYSESVYNMFMQLAGSVYDEYGANSGEQPADNGEGSSKNKTGGDTGTYAIIIALALIIMLRGWRISAKYRRRYAKGYVYKRQTFTKPYSRVGARHDDGDYPSGFGGVGTFDGNIRENKNPEADEKRAGESTEDSAE